MTTLLRIPLVFKLFVLHKEFLCFANYFEICQYNFFRHSHDVDFRNKTISNQALYLSRVEVQNVDLCEVDEQQAVYIALTCYCILLFNAHALSVNHKQCFLYMQKNTKSVL